MFIDQYVVAETMTETPSAAVAVLNYCLSLTLFLPAVLLVYCEDRLVGWQARCVW